MKSDSGREPKHKITSLLSGINQKFKKLFFCDHLISSVLHAYCVKYHLFFFTISLIVISAKYFLRPQAPQEREYSQTSPIFRLLMSAGWFDPLTQPMQSLSTIPVHTHWSISLTTPVWMCKFTTLSVLFARPTRHLFMCDHIPSGHHPPLL